MQNQSIKRLGDFIDASPTQFHAADSLAASLRAAGAVRLDEREAWKLESGKTYFIERNGSAVIAFRTGRRPPAEAGFMIVAAHTDAPALRVRAEKPLSRKRSVSVPVEVYGGPLVATWLDRPLALAGRVSWRDASGRIARGLVNTGKPVALVPNLAIHLNRDFNKGIEYNAQNQLPALAEAHGPDAGDLAADKPWGVSIAASALGVEPDAILGTELFLVEAQRSCDIGEGLFNAPRLDDLAGCHAALEAFLASAPADHAQMAAFFDNEEIGSSTLQGAAGPFLRDLMERVTASTDPSIEARNRAFARSFLVSVDAAHAFHPNYADKSDDHYSPCLNGGPAIKANAGFKYATDAVSEAAFRSFCAVAKVPCQAFRTRSDMTPGSTIGPMTSTLIGIRTVDVGHPLLAMHSIRETMGALDHGHMIAALGAAFAAGPDVD